MTITTTQLKQANKIFVERDYYYALDSLNKEIIRNQDVILNASYVTIDSICSNNLSLQKSLIDSNNEITQLKETKRRRGRIICGMVGLWLVMGLSLLL